jgi:hypothetical protein
MTSGSALGGPADDGGAPQFGPDTPVIVQRTVIDGNRPALFVIHDDEGDWLVGDGVSDPNLPGASGVFHMSHLLAIDSTIGQTADLPVGFFAERSSPDEPWVVAEFRYED